MLVLADIPFPFVVTRHGAMQLAPVPFTTCNLEAFFYGPAVEIRSLQGRGIIHSPLAHVRGLAYNEFASRMCNKPIFGDIIVLPQDSFSFTTSPA